MSVFNIGNLMYHQSGPDFYQFNERRKTFIYDKFVSDLFHDYFGTRLLKSNDTDSAFQTRDTE